MKYFFTLSTLFLILVVGCSYISKNKLNVSGHDIRYGLTYGNQLNFVFEREMQFNLFK